MKALYLAFFHIPKHGRVRDKVLLTRVAVSVISMVFLLAAMSATAYAFFSCSISSGNNVIQAANFDAVVTVKAPDGTEVSVENTENNRYRATLEADVLYAVTVQPTGTAQTGFCVVSAEDGDKVYHTRQMSKPEGQPDGAAEPMSFALKVTAGATVEFFAHWGTSSHYPAYSRGEENELYIQDGGEVTIVIDSEEPTGEEVTTTTTTTEATTATTSETAAETTTATATTTGTTTEATQTTATSAGTQTAAPSASTTETTVTTATAQTDTVTQEEGDTPTTEETE